MNIIKRARLIANLTQEELARRAGVPQPSLARIERGRVTPRLDTVIRILRACDMRLDAVPRGGAGIDRSTIRQMLALTPAQRLAIATTEAHNLEAFQR